MKIFIDSDIRNTVMIGCLEIGNLVCRPFNKELWDEIELLAETYRKNYNTPSDALEKFRPARNLYRAIGIEPTKIRPSSEALFRRVVKGKDLYKINSIVDVCNYCSLKFFLPIGLYDLEKIRGTIHVRFGKKEEGYKGIGKSFINVEKKMTLADEKGAFGNPSADSMRTSIDLQSNHILIVIFAPIRYNLEMIYKHIDFSLLTMVKYHTTGKLIESSLIK